jgi:hypothetical protein
VQEATLELLQKDELASTFKEGEVVKGKVGEKVDVLELPWLHNGLPFEHRLVLDHHLRCWKCHYLY